MTSLTILKALVSIANVSILTSALVLTRERVRHTDRILSTIIQDIARLCRAFITIANKARIALALIIAGCSEYTSRLGIAVRVLIAWRRLTQVAITLVTSQTATDSSIVLIVYNTFSIRSTL